MSTVRAAAATSALVAVLGCSACVTPKPAPAPSPSAIPLRTVAACPASVVVPGDTTPAAPSATAPPTVIVRVGGAVSFPVPAGARLGISGDADAAADAQVCAAKATAATSVTLVAQQPGYLRIAAQVGIEAPLRVFVKVTS